MAYHGNEFQVFHSVSSVELTPEEGKAWKVTRISVVGGSENDTMEVKVGKTSVFYAPIIWGGKNLFSLPGASQEYVNLFDALAAVGKELKIPVPAGKKLTITFSSTVTTVKVEYEVYDAGDVRGNELNGPEADEMIYLAWIANSEAVTASGYVTLDSTKLPPEYPDFPAAAVPAGFTAEIFGIAVRAFAASVVDGSASTGTSYSKHARIFYRRQVLFDPNRVGWVTLGDSSYSETGTTMTYSYDPVANELALPPKLGQHLPLIIPHIEIPAGEEANVQVEVEHASGVDVPAGAVQAILFVHLKPRR